MFVHRKQSTQREGSELFSKVFSTVVQDIQAGQEQLGWVEQVEQAEQAEQVEQEQLGWVEQVELDTAEAEQEPGVEVEYMDNPVRNMQAVLEEWSVKSLCSEQVL